MPQITTRELKERREEFLEEAGRAFDKMLGRDGQNGLATFEQREDRACELGDVLTRRLLEEHLAADELADPGHEVDCPICGGSVLCELPEEVELQKRTVQTRRGPVDYERAARMCKPCRRSFSPEDERLDLGSEGYSPGMLRKIEYAGGNNRSFETAAQTLQRLAESSISSRHVERLTERLGKERAAERDVGSAAMQLGKLHSSYKQAPAVAVVMLDAGKAQFRQEDSGPGVHGPRWGDTKVACLETYTDVGYDKDPQPDPPEKFLDPVRVERLCREMQRVRGAAGDKPAEEKPAEEKKQTPEKPRRKKRRRRRKRPERLVRTVVATTAKVEEFGWMVSAEAMKRKMYAARKRAVLGDGGNWIEPLGQMHFPGWLQILDFLHLLVHLYAGARLAYAKDPRAAWKLYERMLRDAWGGRVQAVIDVLSQQVKRLRGDRSAGEHACDVVKLVLEYVERNRERMDYPRYRRMGLPVSSAPVESLIKQINHRVKGSEQFWNSGGLESVLQVRAAYLSEDGRAEEFHERRPRGPAVGRNRAKLLQPTV